jgi:hypothetical protein
MRSRPTLLGLAFAASASAAALGGCSAGGSASAPSGANALPSLAQSNAQKLTASAGLGLEKSWMSPATKSTSLLYVSDGEESQVYIYPATEHNKFPIGQLSGFDIAAGLAVDSTGNLYVADVVSERVQVFHRGDTSPFEILNVHGYPYGEAVDNSGNVYVAVAQTGSVQGFVAIYPPGATEPTSTLNDPSRGFSPVDVALDSQDNVFVTYDGSINTPPGGVDEFKAGTTTPIKLVSVPKGPGFLTIDQSGNVVVPDGKKVRVYPPGSKTPSLTFGASTKNAPTSVALNQAGNLIYVGENGANPPVLNSVKVYTYPGAKLVNTIDRGLPAGNPIDGVIGVALDPRSSP